MICVVVSVGQRTALSVTLTCLDHDKKPEERQQFCISPVRAQIVKSWIDFDENQPGCSSS
jgi:hypothetical protein